MLLLGACAAAPPARAPVKTGEEFTLALGESIGIESKGVILKFERVIEDSRCPMNARCIWEGNARIAIKASDSAVERHELNTSTRFSTSAKITNFVLELRRLEPDRLAGAPTKGYAATLFVGVH
ncbi:MAG: hypothetical protein ABI821_19170 [Pseudomonadota bacterium]